MIANGVQIERECERIVHNCKMDIYFTSCLFCTVLQHCAISKPQTAQKQ